MRNENWNGRWWLVAPALILLLSLAPAAPAAPRAEEDRGVGPRGVWSAVLAATADGWAGLLAVVGARVPSSAGSGSPIDPDDGSVVEPDGTVTLSDSDEYGPLVDPNG